MALQPGTVVNGRYEVVKCLGTGSMGMVYACRHRELAGHIVAMKVLFSEVARDEVAAQRFRNEIVASYGVSHPNVVRAYEYFRDGDLIAFTMEYIGGGDLADRISGDDPIPISEIVTMLCQMASGVQAIHDAEIIHRDLKPENILLTAQGDIKITDFGIARPFTGQRLTEHGGVVGTIDYVSPEYLEKGNVDHRSDIYAFGVLAYEMITTESPFKGKSVIESMTMRLRTDPEPPHTLRPECPAGLSQIVLKAMARDPADRYQQASEVLADLEELSASGLLSSESKGKTVESGAAVRIQQSKIESFAASAPLQNAASDALEAGAATLGGAFNHSQVDIEIPTSAGTVQLSSGAVASINRSSRQETLDPYRSSGSLLQNQIPSFDRLNPQSAEGRGVMGGLSGSHSRRISVTEQSLTSQRIKELSLDLSQSPLDSPVKLFLKLLIVLGLGFGVGLFFVQYV